MTKRRFERWYPIAIPLLIIFLFYRIGINEIIFKRVDVFISSLITVGVTIIGFVITIIAILIGILDKKIMGIINKNKAINLLGEYLIFPVVLGFILIINSLLLSYFIDENSIISGVFFYLMVFSIFSFFLSLLRMIYVLAYLFKNVSQEYLPENKDEEIQKLEEYDTF